MTHAATVADRARTLIAIELGVDAVTDDQVLREINDFDSLDTIEICIVCEREFDIDIPVGEMDAWSTVADVVRTVERLAPGAAT